LPSRSPHQPSALGFRARQRAHLFANGMLASTAVRAAVQKGNVARVTALLKTDSSLDSAPGEPSLLALALSKGHIGVANLLLQRGAPQADGEGCDLLVWALKAEGGALVEPILALLGDGAAAAVRTTIREWTPLMHAAKLGHPDAVEALLRAGSEVDAKMARRGGTALMITAQHTQPAATRALLAAKASIEMVDSQGWTALHWAAQIGPLEVIELLVGAGASVAATPGHSSAMMVAVENGHAAAATALIAAGSDVEAPDAQGWTALAIAAAAGNAKIVSCLLDARASVQARRPPLRSSLDLVGTARRSRRSRRSRHKWTRRRRALMSRREPSRRAARRSWPPHRRATLPRSPCCSPTPPATSPRATRATQPGPTR